VRELLLAGRRRVREILVAADMEPSQVVDDIVELARDQKVAVREVSRRAFDAEARTQAPQGVLARCAPLAETPLDDLAARPGAFLLVLDGVTDPQNLGAVLRAAECAGVTGVVLPRHRSVHVTPTVTKAAAGAVEHLPLCLVGGVPTAIGRLRQLEVLTIGLDAAGPTPVFDLPVGPGDRVALVLGAEGAGLGRLVRQRVDLLASIPMRGQLNSLNVAAAAAVACFEVVRQRER
jgi:23S rRNA (guanosine2251-2'-O)-methyltransferase